MATVLKRRPNIWLWPAAQIDIAASQDSRDFTGQLSKAGVRIGRLVKVVTEIAVRAVILHTTDRVTRHELPASHFRHRRRRLLTVVSFSRCATAHVVHFG